MIFNKGITLLCLKRMQEACNVVLDVSNQNKNVVDCGNCTRHWTSRPNARNNLSARR